MKKVLCLVLALIMAMTLCVTLTGCSSEPLRFAITNYTSKELDIDANTATIMSAIEENKAENVDFVIFGQSFLQGFNAMTGDIEKDILTAVAQDSAEITKIREKAIECKTGVGFGYFEKDGELIYNSFILIDSEGKTVSNFRRMHRGWHYKFISDNYADGKDMTVFTYKNWTIAGAICGDLFNGVRDLDTKKFDVLLWPACEELTAEEWADMGNVWFTTRVGQLGTDAIVVNTLQEEKTENSAGWYYNNGTFTKMVEVGATETMIVEFTK